MKTVPANSHPTEEMLIEYALERTHQELAPHIDGCPSCSRYVREIADLNNSFRGIEEEGVPQNVRRQVLDISRKSAVSYRIWEVLGGWYRNPFLLILGFCLFASFLYFFFEYVLSK
jgi:hypothetical protein